MQEIEVRIAELEPMRVASTHAFGKSPEYAALDKLVAWARPQGLLETPGAQRVFGFNNPSPAPGSPNYGYEFWMEVGREVEAEGEITIKEFAGGLYAVTRSCGVEQIGPTWHQLARWREESRYESASHQWLEEHIGELPAAEEDLVLDLYLPIAE